MTWQSCRLSCFSSGSTGRYNKKWEGYMRTQLHSLSNVIGLDTLKYSRSLIKPPKTQPSIKSVLNPLHTHPYFMCTTTTKQTHPTYTLRNNLTSQCNVYLFSFYIYYRLIYMYMNELLFAACLVSGNLRHNFYTDLHKRPSQISEKVMKFNFSFTVALMHLFLLYE